MNTTIFANPGQTVSIVVQTLDGYFDGYSFQESIAPTDNQTIFTLSRLPGNNESVSMYLNGVKQQYSVDYTVSGLVVTYLGILAIESTDTVEFTYSYTSSGGGDRIDSGTPQVMSIYFPDRSLAVGFPQNMTRLETGLYVFDIIIPSGQTYLGTFICSTKHTEGNRVVWNTFLINVARPFGNSSASPI